MVPHQPSLRIRALRAAAALFGLSFAFCAVTPADAQGFMRTPSISVGARLPSIAPTGVPNIGAIRMPTVQPVLPSPHYSPNLHPACPAAERTADGECLNGALSSDSGGAGANGPRDKRAARRRNDNATLPAANLRVIPGQIVAELDGTLSDAQADQLARRHGLARVASQNFPLLDATIGLFRIIDRRPLDTVSRELAGDGSVRSVQPNFRYLLQEQQAPLSEGDPAQWALAKLRLPEAHALARGTDVRIAVIDSGIDATHPELTGSIVDSFDALGSREGPHVHGTGIAGAIVAHARLMGGAPKAQILAIRAFGLSSGSAESNSYVVLKGLDYAAAHKAQIVNMSFAGAKDPLIERGMAALASRGVVLVAAAGNAGPKSPPLYPAANPNVIAVSATDAQDHLLPASNRGSYVSVAAPGADIFLPAPDGKYQMISGTSFSAAYVSALAALLLERNPELKPNDIRTILTRTARDLGSPGRDDLFGAGEPDAYAAVQAVPAALAAPATGASAKPAAENPGEGAEIPLVPAVNPPVAAIASEKPGDGAVHRPSAR
jgi:subtilisin family serine protease